MLSRVASRRLSTVGRQHGLVLGSGSNVVDVFLPVSRLPQPGDKTYFSHPNIASTTVVGGVTLNHLAWARELGAPTGLLALQGEDDNGRIVRSKLDELGVATEFIKVAPQYTTSVSHILTEKAGERTILMAKAATAQLTGDTMAAAFGQAVEGASMLTTEISQLPLSGVLYLLESARRRGIPSVLDVDVPPSIAVGAAELGTLDELRKCVTGASLVKLTASAAPELLELIAAGKGVRMPSSLDELALQLCELLGAHVHTVAITDGKHGAAFASKGKGQGDKVAALRPIYPGVTQVDATGAGDAFFGGIIAALHARGNQLPTTKQELEWMAGVAAAAGAACVEVVGALPVSVTSAERMVQLNPACEELVDKARKLPKKGAAKSSSNVNSSAKPASAASSTSSSNSGSPLSYAQLSDRQVGMAAAAVESLVADAVTLRAFADGVGNTSTLAKPGVNFPLGIADLVTYLVDRCSASTSGGEQVSTRASAVVTGVGKSGAVAQRLATSLRSLGIAASFVHAAEMAHGDLGGLRQGDLVIAFSHSGKTPELLRLIPYFEKKDVKLVTVTSDPFSPLATPSFDGSSHGHSQLTTPILVRGGALSELLGVVPSRSIIAQEAACNAILAAVVDARGAQKSLEIFKQNHPGGAIGEAHNSSKSK